jgi:hypothetical protein
MQERLGGCAFEDGKLITVISEPYMHKHMEDYGNGPKEYENEFINVRYEGKIFRVLNRTSEQQPWKTH